MADLASAEEEEDEETGHQACGEHGLERDLAPPCLGTTTGQNLRTCWGYLVVMRYMVGIY